MNASKLHEKLAAEKEKERQNTISHDISNPNIADTLSLSINSPFSTLRASKDNTIDQRKFFNERNKRNNTLNSIRLLTQFK